MTPGRSLLALAGMLAGFGCTAAHQMYPGPERPDNEVAIVGTDGMEIAAVEGNRRGVGDTVAILPGKTRLTVRLDDEKAPSQVLAVSHRTSRSEVAVCFVAKAGHRYVARPNYDDQAWRAEIVDQTITEMVPTSEDCGRTTGGYSESVRTSPFMSVPTRSTEK